MREDTVYVNRQPVALKNDKKDNKAPLHHLRSEHVEGMCRVFDWAEKKYPRQENGDPNYLLGHEQSQLLAAIIRHALAAMNGEELDPESGFPHIDHIMCGGAMINSQKKAGTLR